MKLAFPPRVVAFSHSGCPDSEGKVNAFESQLLSALKSQEAGGTVEDSTGWNMLSFQKALEQCFNLPNAKTL